MGFFEWLKNGAQQTAQYIGQKSKDAAEFIGSKVKDVIPSIGAIASGVVDIAGLADGVIPGAGLVKRGAEWVAGQVKNGNAKNALELAKTSLDTLAGNQSVSSGFDSGKALANGFKKR